jgi:IS5 family transposase
MPAGLDRGQRRGAGAAVVARDQHVVGVRLRHARRDRADADLGHELHADPRARVAAAQVVDQLLEVLDRVDVVVRRRRDQADARRREADRADVLSTLWPGQLAALAGLGALGHLDLQLVGVDEVVDVTPKRPEATA